MLNSFKVLIFSFSIILLFTQCGDDSEGPTNTGDPSGLNVEWIQNEATPDVLEIRATANNAETFEFDPGDGNDIVTGASGNFIHTYNASATYNPSIKVFGPSGRFVEEDQIIVIDLGENDVAEYAGFELMWSDEFNTSFLNRTFDSVYFLRIN